MSAKLAAVKRDNVTVIDKKLALVVPKELVTAPPPEPVIGSDYAVLETDGTLEDLTLLKKPFRTQMAILGQESDELTAQIEELTASRNAVDAQIAELLDDEKVKSVTYGDLKACYVFSSNSSISADLLLANGVSSSVIAACKKTKNYRYFSMTNIARAEAKRLAKAAAKK